MKHKKSKASPAGLEAKRYAESKEHYCPFGPLAAKKDAVSLARLTNSARPKDIQADVASFLKDPKKESLVLAFPRKITDFEASKEQAIRHYLTLAKAIQAVQNPNLSPAEIAELVKDNIEKYLRDPDAEVIPHLAAINPITQVPDTLFTIFMGPCYPEGHARYAPYPMLVSVWGLQLDQASLHHPKLVDGIRDRIRSQYGGLYDADVLVLPINPEIIPEESNDTNLSQLVSNMRLKLSTPQSP